MDREEKRKLYWGIVFVTMICLDNLYFFCPQISKPDNTAVIVTIIAYMEFNNPKTK